MRVTGVPASLHPWGWVTAMRGQTGGHRMWSRSDELRCPGPLTVAILAPRCPTPTPTRQHRASRPWTPGHGPLKTSGASPGPCCYSLQEPPAIPALLHHRQPLLCLAEPAPEPASLPRPPTHPRHDPPPPLWFPQPQKFSPGPDPASGCHTGGSCPRPAGTVVLCFLMSHRDSPTCVPCPSLSQPCRHQGQEQVRLECTGVSWLQAPHRSHSPQDQAQACPRRCHRAPLVSYRCRPCSQ